jgi:hypothetical protein
MGSFGPGGQVDRGKTRDLKAVELVERGFAALPANGPAFVTVKTPEGTPVLVANRPAAAKPPAPAEAPSPVIKFSIPGAKK